MTIEPKIFVRAMTRLWETNLKLITSSGLQEVWGQIACTFNNQIKKPSSEQWQVLQPSTGTGKTQCIAVYCALLSKLPNTPNIKVVGNRVITEKVHPGVLVVTRLIDEANSLVEQINHNSESETARAYNRESRLSDEEMTSTPVLVITHSEYQATLRAISKNSQRRPIYDWQHNGRRLVIIDEALDIVDYDQVNIENIRHTLSLIPELIREEHLTAVKFLEELIEWIRNISRNDAREQMLSNDSILTRQPDFDELRKALRHFLTCSPSSSQS